MTALGELLVEHAEEILARVQAARADLTLQADRRNTLRVGVFPSVATGLLPSVLRELAAKAPELRVEPVESAGNAALFELVQQGEVDVSSANLPLAATFWHRDRVHGDALEVFREATTKIAGELGTRARPDELAAA